MKSHSKTVLQLSAMYPFRAMHNIFLHFGEKKGLKNISREAKLTLFHNRVTVLLMSEGDIRGKTLSK